LPRPELAGAFSGVPERQLIEPRAGLLLLAWEHMHVLAEERLHIAAQALGDREPSIRLANDLT